MCIPRVISTLRTYVYKYIILLSCKKPERYCLQLSYIFYSNNNKCYFTGAIDLLKQTSKLVKFFREDKRPLTDSQDLGRLDTILEVNTWFSTWETDMVSAGQPNKCMVTAETRQDIKSCILGFVRLVKLRYDIAPGTGIYPTLVNSDVIENIFCQYRATYNGASANPPLRVVQKLMTTVTVGQSAVSTHSNAGRSSPAMPYSMHFPGSLNKWRTCSKRLSGLTDVTNLPVKKGKTENASIANVS